MSEPADHWQPPSGNSRPIVTLTTDFGTTDWYAATLKAVLLAGGADCQPIDITHEIPPGDIIRGSIVIERAISAFPPGTIHLAVVDPGVGSSRRIIIGEIRRQLLLCPDNGLITWTIRRHPPDRIYELTWRPPTVSSTFHGRDIMAPAAAKLARGEPVSSMASPIDDPVLLDLDIAGTPSDGKVIYCDRFGNAITNIPHSQARHAAGRILAAGHDLGPLKTTYSDVPIGTPLALIGSSGLVEISVREGSAVATLGLKVGDGVRIEGGSPC